MKHQKSIKRTRLFRKFFGSFFLHVFAFAGASAATGDVDTAFDAGIANSQGAPFVNAIVVQPNNKILLSGQFTSVGGMARNHIARLNADGTPDTTFSSPFLPESTSAQALALQSDGKILVGGNIRLANGSDIRMTRLNADGSFDTTFTNVNFVASVLTIALLADGKILIGGNSLGVFRLNPNGTRDFSFAEGVIPGGGFIRSIDVQTDGKIIAVGTFVTSGTPGINNIVRLNTDGSLDPTFSIGSGANNNIFDAQIQTDGRILVGGAFTAINGVSRSFIARLNPNGSLDSTFAPTLNQSVSSMLFQADGKILIGGDFTQINSAERFRIARLNADGSLDSFYPLNGLPNGGLNNAALAFAAQSCRKILIGGSFSAAGNLPRSRFARLIDSAVKSAADFDGDGCSDISVFRPSSGVWYSQRSANGFSAVQWGLATDKLVPADYDGDGKTDVAVWRSGVFYILNSSNLSVRVEAFGQTGDVPVAGDFDGDSRADLAVYRGAVQSIFFFRASLNNPNGNTTFLPWGTNGDVPVVSDYDGDGRADAAVFRPSNSTWFALRSSNLTVQTAVFGSSSDKLVPADYDGDGKTDLAIFRGGVWWILNSASATVGTVNWGTTGDTPVPADYDSDGRSDLAIYRNGEWWIRHVPSGGYSVKVFGLANDAPVPAAYVR